MKKVNHFKYAVRVLMLFLTVLLMTMIGKETIQADELPDITIKAEHAEHVPIPNVTFNLYRIATVTDKGKLLYQDSYQSLHLNTEPIQEDTIQSMTNTLSTYIDAQKIAPIQRKMTDNQGMLTFVLNDYPESGAVYLVKSEVVAISTTQRLSFQPLLVQIPYPSSQSLHPIFAPKPITLQNEAQKINLSTIKVWKDDASSRPTSVKVGLYHNGNKQDEQILNNQNNWRYTWKNLENDGKWQVIEEEIPSQYSVSIAQNQQTFVITNTQIPTSITPSTLTNTTPTNYSSNRYSTARLPITGLPKTGVLWWPVSVFAILGAITLALGVMMRKSRLKYFTYVGVCLIGLASGMTIYNFWDDYRAGKESQNLLHDLTDIPNLSKVASEETIWDKDMSMVTKKVDQQEVLGVINIDKLNLHLPILSEWSMENSKQAPCRYVGSLYKNNLIVAGHNYQAHFAKLDQLEIGDKVQVKDLEGRQFEYKVKAIEMIDGKDVTSMLDGKWDLTLFTCNYDGTQRFTLRCEKVVGEV